MPLEVELRDPPTTPVYQRIAAEAAAMQDEGVRVAAIARHFGVDHHGRQGDSLVQAAAPPARRRDRLGAFRQGSGPRGPTVVGND